MGTRPVDFDNTLDEENQTHVADLPFDRIRTSYDLVAERYAAELSDEIVAKPTERGMLLAFAELVRARGPGLVGDVACGPGHIAAHLTGLGLRVVGYDISAAMIAQAQAKFPVGMYQVGSMFHLPAGNAEWRGAVARHAMLHCSPDERIRVLRELARVIEPDGYLLYGFYISAPGQPEGSVFHLGSWFGFNVDLDIHFVGIEEAYDELERCGFVVEAAMVREPMMKGELPTRRCYLFGRRAA